MFVCLNCPSLLLFVCLLLLQCRTMVLPRTTSRNTNTRAGSVKFGFRRNTTFCIKTFSGNHIGRKKVVNFKISEAGLQVMKKYTTAVTISAHAINFIIRFMGVKWKFAKERWIKLHGALQRAKRRKRAMSSPRPHTLAPIQTFRAGSRFCAGSRTAGQLTPKYGGRFLQSKFTRPFK